MPKPQSFISPEFAPFLPLTHKPFVHAAPPLSSPRAPSHLSDPTREVLFSVFFSAMILL